MSYCSFAMYIGLTVERMIALLLFLKSLKASDVIVLSQFLKQTKDLDGKLQIENTSRPVADLGGGGMHPPPTSLNITYI